MSEETCAEILNLSAKILLGKATKQEIEEVCKRARSAGEFEFFKQEIKDCDRIIRG